MEEFFKATGASMLQFGGLGVCGYLLSKTFKHRKSDFVNIKLHQTIEDRSCSTHIIGVQGSGKTYWGMKMFIDDVEKGYGALWMSTQGVENSGLLDYIPKERVDKTILFRPYIDRLLGINLLKTYTNSQLERSLVADSVVTLFKRLFDKFGENMEGILTASTLALLEYADKTNDKVSLWDLYIFLSDIGYRRRVIGSIDNIVAIDMLNEISEDDSKSKMSLDALLRRFRKLLYHDQMVAFLSQKDDDVDLLQAVKDKKIIICDFLAGGQSSQGIGKENSKFLAELMVSKFQLIAETRNVHSSLYPLYLDEFQTYTSTSENIRDFIDLNRQRRMPVTLIQQRRSQSVNLKDVTDSCGTKYIFKLNPNDIGHYSKMYPFYADKISKLAMRDFIGDIRSYGKNYDFVDRTPDLPAKSNFGDLIKSNNTGKYSTAEIIKRISQDNSSVFESDSSMFQ